jgi:hypothetical protein
MSLKNRLASPRPVGTKDIEFTCPHYEPIAGSKRCAHYLDGGSCARPDELMCVEWLKANEQSPPSVAQEAPSKTITPDEPRRDLFGNPIPEEPASTKRAIPASHTQTNENASKPPAPERKLPAICNLTEEDIASFKQLNAEICIESEPVGRLWIVPDYTGQDRKEMKYEHAITLAAICAAFPECRISSFEKTNLNGEEQRGYDDVSK